jgi:hypothetical protein
MLNQSEQKKIKKPEFTCFFGLAPDKEMPGANVQACKKVYSPMFSRVIP